MRVGDGLLKLLGLCLLAGVLMAGMLFPVVGALGVVSNRASDTIDSVSAELVSTPAPMVTSITDSKGKPIAYLYDQYRLPLTADQISPEMKAALISVEDRRFFEHHGVDWQGTLRAAISNQTSEDTQGASTLTQQYVKNYLINVVYRDQVGEEPDPAKKIQRERAQEQTITRKLREARLAVQLEQTMSKDEILAGYLNVVEFTDRIFGVGAAARAYFDTTADKLTIPQAALLAGMVNNPYLYSPWSNPEESLRRRNLVIDTMVGTKSITEAAGEEAKKQPLGVLPEPVKPASNCTGAGPEYGFYCQFVLEYLLEIGFTEDQLYAGGYTIKTSFDARATRLAKQAAENQVPKTTDGINNSMAIVRPGKERHEVVALVSNRDYGLNADAGQTTLGYPYDVENKFGAGSIYKIFTSAAFLEKGGGINNVIDTPSRHVSNVFTGGNPENCPQTSDPIDGDTTWYCLSNANDDYPSQMTLREGLKTSPNTGFVILEERVGMTPIVEMASRLGLRKSMATNMSGNTPNPDAEMHENQVSQTEFFRAKGPNRPGNASFTLGPSPLSTLELANVGATLMSGGVWCPPTPLVEVLDRNGNKVDINEQPCEQAVDPGLANTLVHGLSDDHHPGGTAANAASQYDWTRPMLGKTGTTQQHRSAGFVGATPQLSAAVLTFNDGRSPEGICDSDPPTLCGENGNIFGGRIPARTWFEAMKPIHEGARVLPLPPTTPRYVDGGAENRVPNVVGDSEEDATAELEEAGYKVVAEEINSSQQQGTVVSQSPRGNALKGETITILISTGYVPPPQTEQDEPSLPPEGDGGNGGDGDNGGGNNDGGGGNGGGNGGGPGGGGGGGGDGRPPDGEEGPGTPP
ncbi:penicillin-binding protein [Actinophytocola gossypii]|uniref:Penicillin-binding protein n=1 Tax=Actinophytocola gossypii TaxID=2812003 RepID=A0ABT2J4P7_9PSEU|nr:transglycosylase domain-containing protein [Actinophytocola gossypii]MCT2582460.1 penicillin-binding protein [Actinophytocola gossypii]